MTCRKIALFFWIAALMGCNSKHDNDSRHDNNTPGMDVNTPGMDVLGIHGVYLKLSGVKKVTIVRDIGGMRTEWLSKDMTKDGLYVYTQLGLPGNKMRIAIAGSGGAIASGFPDDQFSQHPCTFIRATIDRGTGEYVLLETSDPDLKKQNRIIAIAE